MPPKTQSPSKNNRRQDYKLWLWVAGGFLVIIAAWTFLILLAREHQPAVIPLENP